MNKLYSYRFAVVLKDGTKSRHTMFDDNEKEARLDVLKFYLDRKHPRPIETIKLLKRKSVT